MSSAPADTRRFLVLFGPPAVGKMTVGRELAARLGYRLLHNHMTIDLVLEFFDYGTPPFRRLNKEFRHRLFEETAEDPSIPGVIFTYVWDFGDDGDKRYLDEVRDLYATSGVETIYVELAATLEARLRRNREPSRLQAKPSKRDVQATEARLLRNEAALRLNSDGDFWYPESHLKLENTAISPGAAADLIVNHFRLDETARTS